VSEDKLSSSSDLKLLTVFVPVFNEVATIDECLRRVLSSPCVAEIIVVDDFSTDGTREFLSSISDPRVRVLFQPKNMGKGAALRLALKTANSQLFIIQDADLEYDPQDFEKIIRPFLKNEADVVFGSRFVGGGERRVPEFWHSIGNKLLTSISNCFTNLYLTDMATCYKCFRTEQLKALELRENRFGIDPEITMKISRQKVRIVEVGVSYSRRSYDEGKKIGIRDALRHLFCIVYYRFRS